MVSVPQPVVSLCVLIFWGAVVYNIQITNALLRLGVSLRQRRKIKWLVRAACGVGCAAVAATSVAHRCDGGYKK